MNPRRWRCTPSRGRACSGRCGTRRQRDRSAGEISHRGDGGEGGGSRRPARGGPEPRTRLHKCCSHIFSTYPTPGKWNPEPYLRPLPCKYPPVPVVIDWMFVRGFCLVCSLGFGRPLPVLALNSPALANLAETNFPGGEHCKFMPKANVEAERGGGMGGG